MVFPGVNVYHEIFEKTKTFWDSGLWWFYTYTYLKLVIDIASVLGSFFNDHITLLYYHWSMRGDNISYLGKVIHNCREISHLCPEEWLCLFTYWDLRFVGISYMLDILFLFLNYSSYFFGSCTITPVIEEQLTGF